MCGIHAPSGEEFTITKFILDYIKKNQKNLQKIIDDFDNKENLRKNIIQIKNNLDRRAKIA